jgi:hypothetical protein
MVLKVWFFECRSILIISLDLLALFPTVRYPSKVVFFSQPRVHPELQPVTVRSGLFLFPKKYFLYIYILAGYT